MAAESPEEQKIKPERPIKKSLKKRAAGKTVKKKVKKSTNNAKSKKKAATTPVENKKEKKPTKAAAKKAYEEQEKKAFGVFGLKPQRAIFVKAFLANDFNGTRAYMLAYGCTETVARSNASRLLASADIKAAIRKELEDTFDELEINPQKILEEIAKMAFCNMEDFTGINEDGTPFVDLTAVKGKRRKMAAIQELTSETYMEKTGDEKVPFVPVKKVRLKLADKGINLERLGRYYKLFSDSAPSPDKIIKTVLKKVLDGDLSVRDAAYHLQMNGIPLPEILKIELTRGKEGGPEENEGPTDDELNQRFLRGIGKIDNQRTEFLPGRQAEIAELKESMKSVSSFDPETKP